VDGDGIGGGGGAGLLAFDVIVGFLLVPGGDVKAAG
jgi:hypothetical protein